MTVDLAAQYRDASKLDARASLYHRFNTNTRGWFDWVFDRFEFREGSRILEVGCGHGLLWRTCAQRIHPSWSITLSDVSSGMLANAREALADASAIFDFDVIDAQSIPRDDGVFDAVIANHMLYHVQDRTRALREIHRVLKPGGRLFASTIGNAHLAEITDMMAEFDSRLLERDRNFLFGFTLHTGESELAAVFHDTRLERYEDALVVTEADPLVEYVRSRADANVLEPQLEAFRDFVAGELTRSGGRMRIGTDTGLFTAAKRS